MRTVIARRGGTAVLLTVCALSAQAQTTAQILLGRALPVATGDFCDDVNRDWATTTPIPASYPWNSSYVENHDVVTRQLQDIVDGINAAPPLVVEQFRRSYTNVELRNTLGLRPLRRDLDEIRRLNGSTDLARLLARFNRSHRDLVSGNRSPTPTPFFTEVWPDPLDSRRQVVFLFAGGLGLPDRSMYLGQEPGLVVLRDRYRAHIARILQLSGDASAQESATAAFSVESALALAHENLAQSQGGSEQVRRYTIQELRSLAPTFDWAAFFRGASLAENQSLVLTQPTFIRSAAELMATLPPERVQAYLRWQLLRRYSSFLTASHADAAFDFFSRTMNGAKDMPSVERSAVEYTAFYLPDELSAAYVARHTAPASKAKAMLIAENVRTAYRDRIRASAWLSEGARTEALRKLDTMNVSLLYPDLPQQQPEISLRADDLIGNLVKLSERAYSTALDRARQPVDRTDWWTHPIHVNGSYSVSRNSLIVTAARAVPPLFDPMAADADNYGGLGTLIGHEMGHAFDAEGSQYDAAGNVRDWWSGEDRREFERRTARLVEQYARYEPLPGMPLDGKAQINENIADLSGLTIGHEALKRVWPAPTLTPEDERKFFEAWARRWRVRYTEPFLLRILKSDTHPPLQYRCTVPLSNFTAFYEAIGIAPGSPAYLPEQLRVSLW